MKIFHVDVFSQKPFSGNGLTVVFPDNPLTNETMQKIAYEFKQFETIFLQPGDLDTYDARIFTVDEELDFAGHPILGAAAVIHKEFFADETEKIFKIQLNKKTVVTNSMQVHNHYEVNMNQGIPNWGQEVTAPWQEKYCEALNLHLTDLCKDYPMEVVSTGLPYLLVPIKSGLDNAKIKNADFESLLAENGAKFVYIFDMNNMEGRTWDNLGTVEDVATGSAAGPMGAYLYKHLCFKKNEIININQGKALGRPSILKVSCNESTGEIFVSGDVISLAQGELELL